jgi:magnesium-transporting ATPase (P-type)
LQNPKNGGQLKLGGLAPSNLELALLKQYPFDSAVQRMTVVVKKKGTPAYSVYIKGAPEKVASLCRPNTSKKSPPPSRQFAVRILFFCPAANHCLNIQYCRVLKP